MTSPRVASAFEFCEANPQYEHTNKCDKKVDMPIVLRKRRPSGVHVVCFAQVLYKAAKRRACRRYHVDQFHIVHAARHVVVGTDNAP